MNYRWIVAALLILVLLGAGLFAFLGEDDENDAPASSAAASESPSSAGVAGARELYLNPVYDVADKRDIVYATKKNESESVEPLSLDLYMPAKDGEPDKPVFVFIHGGGYKEGTRQDAREFSSELAKRGYAVVSIDYRLRRDPEADLPGTLSDAYEDISDALDWARAHAEEYGLVWLSGEIPPGAIWRRTM